MSAGFNSNSFLNTKQDSSARPAALNAGAEEAKT
jgi:hypothetical protein